MEKAPRLGLEKQMLRLAILLIPFALVGILETPTPAAREPVAQRPVRLRWFDTQLSRQEPPQQRLPRVLTNLSGGLA